MATEQLIQPAETNPPLGAFIKGEKQPAPRVFQSEELFAGSKEICIQHGEQQYRLRITAAGKLLMTK